MSLNNSASIITSMNVHILLLSMLLLGCCGLWNMRSACEHAANQELRDRCFSVLALNDDDTELCKEVQNLTARDYCIMKIAIADANDSKCAGLGEDLKCKQIITGVKQNNSLVCGLIKDNETAELCRLRVG